MWIIMLGLGFGLGLAYRVRVRVRNGDDNHDDIFEDDICE